MSSLIDVLKLGGLGVLTPSDLRALNASTRRVLALMADGNWYSPDEIRRAAGVRGVPASEGLRRLRELRAHYDVQRHRVPQSRIFWYRLRPKTIDTELPQELPQQTLTWPNE